MSQYHIHTEIYSVFFIRKPAEILIVNRSSEMAFSHVRKGFRPIPRDLSKHTTDFIQQLQVTWVQTSIARKLRTNSTT